MTTPYVCDQPPLGVRSAGTLQTGVTLDLLSSVGPASYTQGTGIAVDVSANYSSVLAVWVTRAYVTSTLASDTRKWMVHEASTDLYSNRKFRLLCYIGKTPAGTNASAGNTTVAHVPAAVTSLAVAAHVPSSTTAFSKDTCGAISCDGNSAQSTGTHSDLTDVLRTVGGVTDNTLVSAAGNQTFTGTAETVLQEIAGTTALNTITVEYVVMGVHV